MRPLLPLLCLLTCLTAVLAAPAPTSLPPDRKLIEWGWDEPGPAFMRTHAQDMDRLGFDGVIFHADAVRNGQGMNFTWECWSKKQFEWGDFAGSLENLQACQFRRLTDNFLRFNVCPGDVDWFDDAGMAVVWNNAKLAARLAKQGGCKGFMFDVEMYGKPLFSYTEQSKLHAASFEDHEAKVRQRGREYMRAVNSEYPDITMMLTYAYTITGTPAGRPKAPYGLLKSFLDGMFEAAAPQTTIVDGYEHAYGFRKHSQFEGARRTVTQEMLKVTGVPDAYRKHIRVAFGIWMDMNFRRYGWHTNVADFDANYFTPDEFAYSVFSGLHVTDKYVWIYTEKPLWWTHTRVPVAYRQAIRQARRPHVIDDSQVGLRQIKGDPGPPGGGPAAAVQPGYDDESTFGDQKSKYDFIADLPKVWRFRLDKKNVGLQEQWFAPMTDLKDWQTLEIGKFWDEQKIQHVGFAWYRLDWPAPAFTVPAGKDVWLWFGAVDEQAWVYVNGMKAGEHVEDPDQGWDKPFPIKVTGLLKPGGPNTIVVRVGNEALAGGIWKSVKLAIGK
jgi:hypothetical protein